MREAITKSSAHARISALYLIPLLLLLALQGRVLAAHFLTNLADLVLLSRWEAVAEALAPPTCLERSEPLVGVRWLEAALALDPQHEGTWLQKGRALWLEGRCAEAVDAWREAVARNPRDSAAWLLLVETNPAADIRPDPAIAQEIARHLLFRGDRARMAQEWEWALEWYGRAFSLTPDRQTAARMEAVYLQRGWKEEAIARWRELAALLPDSDPDHWWALGRAAELAEQWEEAARAYGEGVRQAQQPYDFLMRQGYAYERLGDWEQAETVYRRAVEARPEQSWPYLGVGHTLRARQDYEGALAWYRQAENLAPRQLDPKYHIGYTYYLLQDYPTAETYFREALAINPQHAWSAYWLARCLYQMGRQDEAIVWLRSAIEWHGRQPWGWAVELGDWLAAAGDRTGALEAYRRALEWKPGDENIQRKIQELLATVLPD